MSKVRLISSKLYVSRKGIFIDDWTNTYSMLNTHEYTHHYVDNTLPYQLVKNMLFSEPFLLPTVSSIVVGYNN